MRKTQWIHIGAALVLAVLLSACASKETYMDLTITSAGNINPDNEGISSPLMLNLYELNSAEQFSKLDYWTLADNGKERLNSDLISQSKEVIVPNEKQHYKILFNDNAKFLGIIANFRNLDKNSTWRYVIDLEKNAHNEVDLHIDGNKIEEVE